VGNRRADAFWVNTAEWKQGSEQDQLIPDSAFGPWTKILIFSLQLVCIMFFLFIVWMFFGLPLSWRPCAAVALRWCICHCESYPSLLRKCNLSAARVFDLYSRIFVSIFSYYLFHMYYLSLCRLPFFFCLISAVCLFLISVIGLSFSIIISVYMYFVYIFCNNYVCLCVCFQRRYLLRILILLPSAICQIKMLNY